MVVPDRTEIGEHIIQEMPSIPYNPHPEIRRAILKFRRSFYWKAMAGNMRKYVENLPVCQMEKI